MTNKLTLERLTELRARKAILSKELEAFAILPSGGE